MAQEENVIIIEEEKEQKKNKLPFIIIILLLFIIIALLLLFLVVLKKKKTQKPQMEIQKITKKLSKTTPATKDEIKQLIKKATILYQKGEKQRALEILSKVSSYSEALSYYNLGVIKLKEKDYKKALEYFQKAIKNKDNRALSAINATYASFMLKNKKLFNYYRNLAYTFLPEIANLKNYPYYYSLVMYYMGYEIETLPALMKTKDYKKEANELLSAVYGYYNENLQAANLQSDPFVKGILYARAKEYSLARLYLSQSLKKEAKFALALVDLKLSIFKQASMLLQQFQDNNVYPIYVYLKPSLFNIKVAQKEFEKNFLNSKQDFYDLFFYYAPYKVFNMNQTISYLKKGIAGIPIGAIEESKTYLTKSAVYSALNIQIAKALQLALNGHVYLANKKFKKLIKNRDNLYILHYNLALTYAQLKNYSLAYKHFLRAYHLNPKDLKSGLYALMALDKMKKTNPYLVNSIKEDFNDSTTLEEGMLAIVNNNTVNLASFLEKESKNTPLWLITRMTAKYMLNRSFLSEALILKSIYPKDIISNLLYLYVSSDDLKHLIQNFQSLYLTGSLNMNDFYYGASIVYDWFFKFSKISGLLNNLRLKVLKKAKVESFDLIPVLKRLAFVNLYTKHFEEAYTIYNDLINNKNITDPQTLYHGAVSAIGANHHSNAVALMELAKLKNPSYYEARFGLGLLWQEANNLKAASIQYGKIPNGFKSKFFDFNIKN